MEKVINFLKKTGFFVLMIILGSVAVALFGAAVVHANLTPAGIGLGLAVLTAVCGYEAFRGQRPSIVSL